MKKTRTRPQLSLPLVMESDVCQLTADAAVATRTRVLPRKWHLKEPQLVMGEGWMIDREEVADQRISGSRDAQKIFFEIWEHDLAVSECFYVMTLNRANRVTGCVMISKGGVAGTVADPKIILATAVKTLSSGIIMAHNHPSGNVTASQADIDLTRKIKEAGKLLEIQLLDHVILTPTQNRYFSFADEGLL